MNVSSRVIAPLLIAFISGCSPHYLASGYSYKGERISYELGYDEEANDIITPYKDSLDKMMNVVLGVADTTLTKSIPESDLGNFMCDLMLSEGRKYYGREIDFTILNNGAIRIPQLPQGNITLGKMIELMPFENRLGVITANGYVYKALFNHMARLGGWQVSNARYTISGDSATYIYVNNQPLHNDSTYTMIASDYVLQGGDNCHMLDTIPFTDLKKTVRDALIEGLQEMTSQGKHVVSVLEERVTKAQP